MSTNGTVHNSSSDSEPMHAMSLAQSIDSVNMIGTAQLHSGASSTNGNNNNDDEVCCQWCANSCIRTFTFFTLLTFCFSALEKYFTIHCLTDAWVLTPVALLLNACYFRSVLSHIYSFSLLSLFYAQHCSIYINCSLVSIPCHSAVLFTVLLKHAMLYVLFGCYYNDFVSALCIFHLHFISDWGSFSLWTDVKPMVTHNCYALPGCAFE